MDDTTACTLGPEELSDRRDQWRAVLASELVASERRSTGIELRLRAAPSTADTLRKLVQAERSCCSFLAWALAVSPQEIVLDIAGPAGTEALFDGWLAQFTASKQTP